MANAYRHSLLKGPSFHHLSPQRNNSINHPPLHHQEQPMTTFTALLCAAQSAELASPGTKVHQNDAIVVPDALATKRRLRNRVSCRKTRLKRKLYQHSLEVLARERHKRHKYLTQLYLCLGSHPDRDNALFREFATTSLHYALVDAQYTEWLDAGKDQVTLPCRSTVECDDDEYDHLPTRKCKRTRRVHDNDVSTAPGNNSRALQTSLVEQWRLIVDGLQNIDLQLHRMDEHEIATGIVDRHCYWKFVGVSSAKMKRFGEIAAVAVSGITRVRFHNHHVEEVNISNVRREDNVPFDCNISCNNTNEAC